MKDEPSESSASKYLKEHFGELGDSEIAQVSRELKREGDSLSQDGKIDELIRSNINGETGDAPALPPGVRAKLETARLDAENGQSGADVYALPRRYHEKCEERSFIGSRWHTSAVVIGGLAVAAAITVAYVSFIRPVIPKTVVTFAEAITLLTPGRETAFLEPVFTWNSENGGVVDVRVLSEDGARVATLENAFSPLRWSAMEIETPLESGKAYQLEITAGGSPLETRSFTTSASAAGAPVPEETLDEIVEQCRGYIEASRPADAWMLWGELTGEQKADPRMQELKAEILALIAG